MDTRNKHGHDELRHEASCIGSVVKFEKANTERDGASLMDSVHQQLGMRRENKKS